MPLSATVSVAQQICLKCGLCCNGVLFKDVELQPGDDAAKLQSLGLPLKTGANRREEAPSSRSAFAIHQSKFPQPCAALCADCRCRIYPDRPSRCRNFECALFKTVAAGTIEVDSALRTIRTACQRADKVRHLLRELGDTDEQLALSLRFKRTRRRLETGIAGAAQADTYAALTLAVHDLNLMLAQEFYPDPGR